MPLVGEVAEMECMVDPNITSATMSEAPLLLSLSNLLKGPLLDSRLVPRVAETEAEACMAAFNTTSVA